MFRNETATVVSRQRLRRRHASNGAAANHTTPPLEDAGFLPPHLFIPLDEIAISVFFNHICGPHFDARFTDAFDYVLPLFNGPGSSSNGFTNVIIAIGLLDLARQQHNQNTRGWLQEAQRRYTRSITETQRVLKDAYRSSNDVTVATVILLGLFEATQMTRLKASRSWQTHIKGAYVLMKLKKARRLDESIPHKMFSYIRKQMIISAFESGEKVPADLLDFSNFGRVTQGESSQVTDDLFAICICFNQLRADMCHKHCVTQSATDQLCDLDGRLSNWATNLDPSYYYTSLAAKPSNEVYGDQVHQYSHPQVASTWNIYRCTRMMLLQLLLRELLETFHDGGQAGFDEKIYDPRIAIIERTIQAIREDVCASIPYLMNYHGLDRKLTNIANSSTSLEPVPDNSAPSFASGNLILWSAYVAASSDMVIVPPKSMVRWVLVQLRRVGKATGLGQAYALAESIAIHNRVGTVDAGQRSQLRGHTDGPID